MIDSRKALFAIGMIFLSWGILPLRGQLKQSAPEAILREVRVTLRTMTGAADSHGVSVSANYSEWTFASTPHAAVLTAPGGTSAPTTISLAVDRSRALKKAEFLRWFRRNEVDITIEQQGGGATSWSYVCSTEYVFSDGSALRQEYSPVTRPAGLQLSQCGMPKSGPNPPGPGDVRVASTCTGRYLTYIKGESAYVCESGKLVIGPSPRFGSAGRFRSDRATIFVDGKYGYIDTAGKIVIAPQFAFATDFSEGLAGFNTEMAIDPNGQTHSGKIGFIDENGKIAISPAFEFAGDFREGMAFAKTHAGVGFINRDGKFIIQPKFDLAGDFSEGFAPVKRGKLWGYVDALGRIIIAPQFHEAGSFSEGLAAVRISGHTGFIDKTGKLVVPAKFGDDLLSKFSGGLAAVTVGKKHGYIDRTGTIIIKPQFDDARGFVGGLAPVEVEGLWGYIDAKGQMVVPPQFREAGAFDSLGIAGVSTTTGVGAYVDRTGRIIWQQPQ